MECKYCSNTLPSEAKFCNKCGKPVEVAKPSVDVAKIRKSLKNTGNSVNAVGWLTIIINVGFYFWGLFDSSLAESGDFPVPDLTSTVLMTAFGVVFIVLGKRISQGTDKNIKRYLQILLVVSIVSLLLILYSGGKVGVLFFLVIAYLISSLISVSKAMKVKEFTDTLTDPAHTLNKTGWIIFAVVTVVLLPVAIGIDLTTQDYSDEYSGIQTDDTYSKSQLIVEAVEQIKTELSLPSRLDDTTTLVDVTAQPSAIRYHYVLSGIDTSSMSNSDLKEYLITDICGGSDTRSLLNQGIGMEYSYSVSGTIQKYFVAFTASDCLN